MACLCFWEENLLSCGFWKTEGSGMPLLFVGRVQIAVQGSGIAENGGKNSVQDFGSCSLFSHLPIGHTRTKEQGMPGNQIRVWVPCWIWTWTLGDGLVLPLVPVDTLQITFNSCCPFYYRTGPQWGENTCCLHASCLPTWISPNTYTWMTSAVVATSFSPLIFLLVYFSWQALGSCAHISLGPAWQKDWSLFNPDGTGSGSCG